MKKNNSNRVESTAVGKGTSFVNLISLSPIKPPVSNVKSGFTLIFGSGVVLSFTKMKETTRELWQYADEDELPPDSLLQAQVEAVRILRIDVPLSANREFQLFCSVHFPGLADILDCLAADQLWALLSMRVQLADSDQSHAQSAAVRFGGLGRRYVLVVFADRPAGLLSHADGSGLFPEARPKLIPISWDEIHAALMLDISSN